MNCPNCGGELAPARRDGLDVESCPACKGLWLTAQELESLEDEAYDLGKKGELVFNGEPSARKCPECASALETFQYRDYDLFLELCPQRHGYWLDAGEDARVLQLMQAEEHALKRTFKAEDRWAWHLRHWRRPDIIDRLCDQFRKL